MISDRWIDDADGERVHDTEPMKPTSIRRVARTIGWSACSLKQQQGIPKKRDGGSADKSSTSIKLTAVQVYTRSRNKPRSSISSTDCIAASSLHYVRTASESPRNVNTTAAAAAVIVGTHTDTFRTRSF